MSDPTSHNRNTDTMVPGRSFVYEPYVSYYARAARQ
jgi:hypothetical protein